MKIISINPFFYLCAFIFIITGHFKYFSFFMLIIIIHELGHISCALFFKWKIDKIIILPFGGLILFNENIDKSLKEEFLILIMGPIFQLIFTLFIKEDYIKNMSYLLLIFNLLPIIPLDGSKFVNIILNKFICFKKSYFLTIYLSIIIIIMIFRFNFLLILTMLFLIKKIFNEYKNFNFVFKKFILEKYLYNFKFRKKRKIKNINNLYRNSNHIILNNNSYITEKELLNNIYN